MRTVAAADLPALIGPGMHVFVHGTATEPRPFVEQLAALDVVPAGLHFFTSFIPGINTVNLTALAGTRTTATMNQPQYADAVAEGRVTALRQPYSQVLETLRAQTFDIAFIQTAPGDGRAFSTGVTGELLPAVVESARAVVAIENPAMPVTRAGVSIDKSVVHYKASWSSPLVTYAGGAGSDDPAARTAAAHVISLVPDGATVQAGIGSVPTTALHALSGHRSLRIFSGMISDGLRTVVEAGATDPSAEHVVGMAMGTEAFYRWLDGRSDIRIAPVGETHAAAVIAGLADFVAINSAIEVGLDGSVNAEFIGGNPVSGPGGLPDYAEGAAKSRSGAQYHCPDVDESLAQRVPYRARRLSRASADRAGRSRRLRRDRIRDR